MISRALFISVAESMVIFGPMSQVGWANASATVTCANSSTVRVRNGPPLAVRTIRATSSRRPDCIAWKIALCSLSTGSTETLRSLASRITSGPATTRLSLLANATGLPASSAAQVPCSPALPTIAESTMSVSASLTARLIPSPPTNNSTPQGKSALLILPAFSGSVAIIQRGRCNAACWTSNARLLWAESAYAASSPRELVITSKAFCPMLPVDPRTAILFNRAMSPIVGKAGEASNMLRLTTVDRSTRTKLCDFNTPKRDNCWKNAFLRSNCLTFLHKTSK